MYLPTYSTYKHSNVQTYKPRNLKFNIFNVGGGSNTIISIIFAPVYAIKGLKIILAMFKNITNFAAQKFK